MRWFTLVWVSLVVAGCASNPISDAIRKHRRERDDRRFRDVVSSQRVAEAQVQDYVRTVGNRVAAKLPERLTVQYSVLDTGIVQGLASRGNAVRVTRGMLNVIQNEAELACLLGHEIAHLSLKHWNRSKSRLPRSLIRKGVKKLEEFTGFEFDFLPDLRTLEVAYWTRKSEQEADEVGAKLAAKAGYNPYAFADLFRRLSEKSSDDVLDWIGMAENSHHLLSSRATHLEKYLKSQGIPDTGNRFRQRYRKSLASLDRTVPEEDGSQSKVLGEIQSIQEEAQAQIQKKEPFTALRFIELMGELSSLAQRYQIQDYLIEESRLFMREGVDQNTPTWGDFLGRMGEAIAGAVEAIAKAGVSFLPGVGDAIDLYEAISGTDFYTGKELTPTERALSAAGIIAGSGRAYRQAADAIKNAGKTAGNAKDVERAVDRAEDFVEGSRRTNPPDPSAPPPKPAPDVQTPKGSRGEVPLPNGWKIPSGSKIDNVETIAQGKGIREVDKLMKEYGGKKKSWRKKKGIARVVDANGNHRLAEVHWYEANGVGRVKYKVKYHD